MSFDGGGAGEAAVWALGMLLFAGVPVPVLTTDSCPTGVCWADSLGFGLPLELDGDVKSTQLLRSFCVFSRPRAVPVAVGSPARSTRPHISE